MLPIRSWISRTPYAVDCWMQVIVKIEKNGRIRACVKLICLQIAICNRVCPENKYCDNNGLP